MLYQQAVFKLSAAKLNQLCADEGYEVAFVGRSNSGKSSSLNSITRLKGLAKTSKTPGRTRLINVFDLDAERRLIDLPGYGFARASRSEQKNWAKLIDAYLTSRTCLCGLVLLMDCRHPLKDSDRCLLDWAKHAELPVQVLLTKADKLKRGAQQQCLSSVKKMLADWDDAWGCQLFSALKNQGLDEARAQLDTWFEIAKT